MSQPKTDQQAIEVAERRRKAVELRKAGASFDDIAVQCGYKDRSGAYRAVKAALKDITREPAEELLTLELARLDAMLLGLWADARKGNVMKIDRVLKIMDRRAKLLGLDAPTRVVVEDAELEQAADRLVARTGRDRAALLAELRERTAAIDRERKAG